LASGSSFPSCVPEGCRGKSKQTRTTKILIPNKPTTFQKNNVRTKAKAEEKPKNVIFNDADLIVVWNLEPWNLFVL
jgi:hypothetical protein